MNIISLNTSQSQEWSHWNMYNVKHMFTFFWLTQWSFSGNMEDFKPTTLAQTNIHSWDNQGTPHQPLVPLAWISCQFASCIVPDWPAISKHPLLSNGYKDKQHIVQPSLTGSNVSYQETENRLLSARNCTESKTICFGAWDTRRHRYINMHCVNTHCVWQTGRRSEADSLCHCTITNSQSRVLHHYCTLHSWRQAYHTFVRTFPTKLVMLILKPTAHSWNKISNTAHNSSKFALTKTNTTNTRAGV